MQVVEQPRQPLVDNLEVLLVLQALQHEVSEHVIAPVPGGGRVFPHRLRIAATFLLVLRGVGGFSVRRRVGAWDMAVMALGERTKTLRQGGCNLKPLVVLFSCAQK